MSKYDLDPEDWGYIRLLIAVRGNITASKAMMITKNYKNYILDRIFKA